MIRLFLGGVGSAKTACAVREMLTDKSSKITMSNIITKKIKNNKILTRSMIMTDMVVGTKRNGENIVKQIFNKEYWQRISDDKNGYHVIIDEAHMIFNARRSMSTHNKIMGEFMSMLRRVLGGRTGDYGCLTLISQLERTLDVIGKEMVNHVQYHVCHYKKTCLKCNLTWNENNEIEESIYYCPRCHSARISKHSHVVEIWRFKNVQSFLDWKQVGIKAYYKHSYILDIETVFPLYDTLQWDNLLD